MDTTISTNILFIVLSIFLAVLSVGFAFIAVYAVKFFNSVNKETEKIISDIDGAREKIKNGGAMFFTFVEKIFSFLKKGRKKNNNN